MREKRKRDIRAVYNQRGLTVTLYQYDSCGIGQITPLDVGAVGLLNLDSERRRFRRYGRQSLGRTRLGQVIIRSGWDW